MAEKHKKAATAAKLNKDKMACNKRQRKDNSFWSTGCKGRWQKSEDSQRQST